MGEGGAKGWEREGQRGGRGRGKGVGEGGAKGWEREGQRGGRGRGKGVGEGGAKGWEREGQRGGRGRGKGVGEGGAKGWEREGQSGGRGRGKVVGDGCFHNPILLTLSILSPFQQSSLSNPRLEARDCVRMVAAIGNVLSTMPIKELSGPLEVLVGSRVRSLDQLAHQDPSDVSKPMVEKELLILSAFCHHIYPTLLNGEQHPVSV